MHERLHADTNFLHLIPKYFSTKLLLSLKYAVAWRKNIGIDLQMKFCVYDTILSFQKDVLTDTSELHRSIFMMNLFLYPRLLKMSFRLKECRKRT
jgi:hypothetical protein